MTILRVAWEQLDISMTDTFNIHCRVHHNIIQQSTTTYDLTFNLSISIEMFWWPGVATSPKAGEMVWTGGWAFASIGSQKRHWHLSHLNLIIGFAPLASKKHVAQEFQGQTCFNKRKTQAFRNFLWCNMICGPKYQVGQLGTAIHLWDVGLCQPSTNWVWFWNAGVSWSS